MYELFLALKTVPVATYSFKWTIRFNSCKQKTIHNYYYFTGKLVLKIPWKNLYNSPVEAQVENLYLLVVPNQEVKYDQEKEKKWAQEVKQAELKKVEEMKKKEREKGLISY